MRSLNHFRSLRNLAMLVRRSWLVLIRGARIAPSVSLSLSSQWIVGSRGAIAVGDHTLIAFKVLLNSREEDGSVRPIRIGRNCFIGGASMILPGVTVGDGAIVGAGAVVMDDVPPNTIVAGNPAKVIARDIRTGRYGRLPQADVNTARLWQATS